MKVIVDHGICIKLGNTNLSLSNYDGLDLKETIKISENSKVNANSITLSLSNKTIGVSGASADINLDNLNLANMAITNTQTLPISALNLVTNDYPADSNFNKALQVTLPSTDLRRGQKQ